MNDFDPVASERLIGLTTDIVTAHVSNNTVAVDQVSALIGTVYDALAGLGADDEQEETTPDPAVSIRSSVKKGHIVCLDCGNKFKTLKRHLMAEHGLTVDEYRNRWNLNSNYPMTAPEFAAARRAVAVKSGLGRKPGQKRGRRKKFG